MTILATMREAASRAALPLVQAGTAGAVIDFVLEQLCDDGGFSDRSGKSDLYYTVFALGALDALAAELPDATGGYLGGFGGGGALDLVHLASLARCWALLRAGPPDEQTRLGMLARLGELRCPDGGFTHLPDGAMPTAYGCFLALGAMQDIEGKHARGGEVGLCIERMRTADGAYANAPGMPVGSTSATAAAVVTLRQLGRSLDASVAPWLLSQYRGGGFLAAAVAPIPDLLSTATALHALAALGASLDAIRPPCLDFVDSLWTGCAFLAHHADDVPDCEYTFYGLLALGHLTAQDT